MIEYPPARTRALYIWEREDIEPRSQLRPLTLLGSEAFVRRVWSDQGWLFRHSCPQIVLLHPNRKHSFCWGRSHLFMRPQDLHPSVLLHELVHARGYGDGRDSHSVGFVKEIVRLWSEYLGWSRRRLYGEAVRRGLLC